MDDTTQPLPAVPEPSPARLDVDWQRIGTWTALVLLWSIQYLIVVPVVLTFVGPFVLAAGWWAARTARRNKGLAAGVAGGWYLNRQAERRHDEHMDLLRTQQGLPPAPPAPRRRPFDGLLRPWGTGLIPPDRPALPPAG
jgi:hypothetical protein